MGPWSAGGSAAERAAELERELAQWTKGGAGERQVGRELDQLPAGAWWVFHDIPRGPSGTNVDHLVIGVGGVFTVNTKNLAGNVWVGERASRERQQDDYLPVAVSEALDVSRRLSRAASSTVQAHPILVFLQEATIKVMPDDVTVLHLGNVREWLQSRTPILTPQQAYEVVLAADRPTTWT